MKIESLGESPFKDRNGKAISDLDILLNSFMPDFWIVKKEGDVSQAKWIAVLISNKGDYAEELEDVCESFQVVGSLHNAILNE